MKIFIDAGALNGDTIKQFYNWVLMVDDPEVYKVYAFEPNPNMKKAMLDIESQHENVTYIPAALWTSDGVMPMAIEIGRAHV